MSLLCSICKRPILDTDLYATFDRGRLTGKEFVHVHHSGVRELYLETYGRDPSHLGLGIMLTLQTLQEVAAQRRLLDTWELKSHDKKTRP